MSRKTKIAVGLSTAGVVAAGFGAASSASAESRTLTVTLAGGTVLQINVDVPPGTPIDQIPLPDLGGLVVRVTGPGPATTPAPTTQAAPATPAPPAATTEATPPAGTTEQAAPTSTDKKKAKKSKRKGWDIGDVAKSAGATAAKDEKEQTVDPAAGAASDTSGDATGPDGTTTRDAGGAPTPADPTFSLSVPGAAPRGVPNFFIDKFRIPPFLLPIYQAAGVQYGVPWEVLAAINEIETDYGRNLSVSSAGAQGWMQFMPATWKGYGVDANGDGSADPYNPVDAIFAAARYLRAAGAEKSIKKAIFAYNHADWYVDSVLLRARLIGGLPPDLVGSLTGLTQGVFPISAKARYAGDDSNQKARARTKGKNAAKTVESSKLKSTNIFSRSGAGAVAVQDGRIVKVGRNPRLGRFVQLRDVYGNTYTYGNLKTVAEFYPVPKAGAMKKAEKAEARRQERLAKAKDPVPEAAATAGEQAAPAKVVSDAVKGVADVARDVTEQVTGNTEPLFANPARPLAKKHGGAEQLANAGLEDGSSKVALNGWDKKDVELKRLKKGARVMAGTVLGRIGKKKGSSTTPHLQFEVHPAGKGSPRVDPKPILDGWKLLESTAVYRAKGSNPLFGDGTATAGQVLLMSKEQLQQRVLSNRNLGIYEEGRRDIAAGAIDRRVLATMEYLTASGLRLTISSLRSGHGKMTTSGNVSEHSTGNAMDIASVNGITISPKTQGPGSITDSTIRQLLQLQGTMKPHQIISLMTPADFPGADNILALPDHDDHIHVGFKPQGGTSGELGKQVQQLLEPGQWIKLIDRIGEITNPEVSPTVSKSAIKTGKAGKGD
ncbi:lytic murein transglycosylase [Patulibacter sp. NPDC049589]|uniref:lytic murein transglycosylase n=1 Tax=Patulibacter sp. NPDC049589 TaxID=3154731 RepID=UPI0034252D9E